MSTTTIRTTAPARWLAKLPEGCIRADLPGLARVEVEGEWWLVVTDGAVMIAERGAALEWIEWPEQTRAKVALWLTPILQSRDRRVDAMREWAGPAEYPTLDRYDPETEETHYFLLPIRWEQIGGMGIDRNRVAQMLEALPAGTEVVRVSFVAHRRQKDAALGRAPKHMLVDAGDVRFVVMECRETVEHITTRPLCSACSEPLDDAALTLGYGAVCTACQLAAARLVAKGKG